MSISSLGAYPSGSLSEMPLPSADQQTKSAVAQASYQSSISDYGQIQNALSSLQSSLQGGQSAALTSDAPARAQAGYAPQENRLFQNGVNVPASPAEAQITQAVQNFVDAYNAQPGASSQVNVQGLAGIGITTHAGGKLSFDAQAFQNALSSDPAGVAQAFSDSVQQSKVSEVASTIQVDRSPPAAAQSPENVRQTPYASQSSTVSQNPEPAQTAQSRAAPSVASDTGTLAAQYSVVSKLG